jgi:hypothetical protein
MIGIAESEVIRYTREITAAGHFLSTLTENITPSAETSAVERAMDVFTMLPQQVQAVFFRHRLAKRLDTLE